MKRSDMFHAIIQARETLSAQGIDPNNISAISALTGISRPTIRNFIQNGGKPAVHGNTGKKKRTKLDAFKEYIRKCLCAGLDNSNRIYDDIKELGYKGGKTAIKDFIREHRNLMPVITKPVVIERARRYYTEPGEAMQMDWGFVNYEKDGNKVRLACFVMVCNYSRMAYIEFFTAARQEFLFLGMIHAFKYFGGVPKKVITDNMKSIVISRAGNDITWNDKYKEFMSDVGFTTHLCKPYHSWTKGRVERYVRYVKGHFVPMREFTDLDDLNNQALTWCRQRSMEVHAHVARPIDRIEEDRKHFSKLPSDRDLFNYLTQPRTVAWDGFVAYEGKRFGVPSTVGHHSTVHIEREGSFITIMNNDGEVVATHNVDWKLYEHWYEGQWRTINDPQVEELPTNPISSMPMRQVSEKEVYGIQDLSIYDNLR